MKKSLPLICLTIFFTACGDKVDPRIEQERLRKSPGFSEARRVCSQCHALPSPNQHPPVAWPGVVRRMENYMRGSNKRMPSQSEHDALLEYFQKNSAWK